VNVTTTYCYIGDGTVVEFVTTVSETSTNMTVNVLPNLLPPGPVPAPDPAYSPPPDPALVAAPLEMRAAAPAPTPRQRTSKGVIRAVWTAVFSFGGEALVYGLNNLTALNLPPGVGLAVGAVGYGAKAAIFPNTKL